MDAALGRAIEFLLVVSLLLPGVLFLAAIVIAAILWRPKREEKIKGFEVKLTSPKPVGPEKERDNDHG